MSAYLWAVQIGMPEGLLPSDQQLWLHKWLLEKDATLDLLTAERITAQRATDECMLEARELWKELAEAREALQELYDWQSGPPLFLWVSRKDDSWCGVMKRAGAVLAK